MAQPDVSVVVAVYNTKPYLTACLRSLLIQTIGLTRLEIIAVDDGSTDGSGEDLDRLAAAHPGVVRVVHQPNSGGPAGPSNRALDMATGRYVFFVGADDYLGPDALRRLVATADRTGADVVLGKMVAVGQRSIPRTVFRASADRLELVGSGALYAISNTKLFRRSFIERHRLRFREDLRVSSDMPFTLEAYLRANAISVVADYDCYYAVRRGDDGNITYGAPWQDRLRVAGHALSLAREIAGPGAVHDEFATRLLRVDLAWIFGSNFLALDRDRRATCVEETAAFLREWYGSDYELLEPALAVQERLRFRWVLAGDVERLVQLVELDTAGETPAIVLEPARAFAAYPGFRDGTNRMPEHVYAITGPVTDPLGTRATVEGISWSGTDMTPGVTVAALVAVVGDVQMARLSLRPGSLARATGSKHARVVATAEPDAVGWVHGSNDLPAASLETLADGSGMRVHADLPLPLAAAADRPQTLELRLDLMAAGITYEVAPRIRDLPLPAPRRWGPGGPQAVVGVRTSRRITVTIWPSEGSIADRLRAFIRRDRRPPLPRR